MVRLADPQPPKKKRRRRADTLFADPRAEYLTLREVAVLLNCALTKVRWMVTLGSLRATRLPPESPRGPLRISKAEFRRKFPEEAHQAPSSVQLSPRSPGSGVRRTLP